MSSSGFRWFICGVVAALVVIMLIVVRSNAEWDGRTPPEADKRHGRLGTPAPSVAALAPIAPAPRRSG